ncbi:MAG: hypothetical protein A2V88_02620 [Elusimicrobia bacterium RBG_16_66_12]|nr:MAG: hypothetical protein A2V88_02620 [Elusimicrobia bacterium RBG_16_66_12]
MSQAVPINVVTPVSQGAGAFLSSAIDISAYEGIVTLEQNLGALSGAFTVPKVTTCETSGGTYTDVTVVAGALGTTQNALTAITFDASQAKKFIKYGATVGTSALISVTLSGFKKYR